LTEVNLPTTKLERCPIERAGLIVAMQQYCVSSPNDLKFASITILKQALGAQGDGIRRTELAPSTLQNLCSIVD
jgi:hypothetical protein